MGNKSMIAAANERIEAILSDRKEQASNLEIRTAESREAVEAAVRDMETATLAGDVDAYRQAKSRKAAAEDALEMQTAQADALEGRPLISKEEYLQLVNGIYSEVAAVNEEIRGKAASLAEEMQKAGEKLRDIQTEANRTLYRLQHDVFRDADRTRTKSGEVMALRAEEKAVDYWDTINWTFAPVRNELYEEITGKHDVVGVVGAVPTAPHKYTTGVKPRSTNKAYEDPIEKWYREAAVNHDLRELSSQISQINDF